MHDFRVETQHKNNTEYFKRVDLGASIYLVTSNEEIALPNSASVSTYIIVVM